MVTPIVIIAGAVLGWILAYHRSSGRTWSIAAACVMVCVTWSAGWSVSVAAAWCAGAALLWLMNAESARRRFVSGPLFHRLQRVLPPLSASEQAALKAGSVWWDGELLSGDPDWSQLRALPAPRLSDEERAFIDGPVDTLCEMLDEWRIAHELHDLPEHAWDYIKREGFLGMIIPKAYGGLGFSALAHSEVIMKLTTRSGTAAVSVMVPNSLGPAELILRYGIQDQKDYYLPRLARGLEIPCFALTSPEAGSDAANIPDLGIVCRGGWQGREGVLGIRLTWEKRYITLAPIATLIGLAFRLRDPDRLLGPVEDVGITIALIPADTPGVHIGRRHLPLDAAFMNGPTWGRDVFIPMDFVIGGVDRVGMGWAMLMNSLAAGRSISLPANSCGVAKLCAMTTGAYSRVRRQFDLPIGRFEGIEAVLARIGGNTYVMEAARKVTAQALDLGEKPAVVSAIVKYQLTERMRRVVNDAMDVHGGKGICMGPSNYLAQPYQQIPIAITVEGANILTRSLIIFGQGLVRGHPYLLQEMTALAEPYADQGARAFDRALVGHLRFFARNLARTLWLGLTNARWLGAPGDARTRRHYAQLTRFSSALALVADVALATLSGGLKRRERLSGRLGDVLGLMYLASCVLKRYEDEGSPDEDLPLMQWAMAETYCGIQQALLAVFENLPARWLGKVLGALVFPRWQAGGREFRMPADSLDREVARVLLAPGPARLRLVAGVFVSKKEHDAVATLESALHAVIVAEPVEAKVKGARRAGRLREVKPSELTAAALERGIITASEAEAVARALQLRRAAVMVDDFPSDLGRTELFQTTQAVAPATPDARNGNGS